MTEQAVTHPGVNYPDTDIAGVHVTISGEELTFGLAARQLRIMADMLDNQMLDSKGFNWQYGGEYEMQVLMPDMYPHGDYHDDEGNLVHIHDDTVISVIWANKGAEKEDVEVNVMAWTQQHGKLTPAGQGEAAHGH